jgi:2-(1,2-epoxy-1,2-dihydrophenyl)acetyl-CoA isomerase
MDAVRETFENGVYTVLMNRPGKKNAMDSELLADLLSALRRADEQKPPIIVIRGSGKAFCAGGDIMEFRSSTDTGPLIDTMAAVLHQSISLIRKTGSIVIAVMEGVAVGAGVGLSLACDISLAANTTIINMGYRRIGLSTDGGASILLPRIIGAKKFNELYLFSRNISMTEALELGLVNFICPEEELEEKLQQIIRDLMALPMETVRYFKDLVNHSCFFGLEEHLDKERSYVAELGGNPLFKQRLDQFFSKK